MNFQYNPSLREDFPGFRRKQNFCEKFINNKILCYMMINIFHDNLRKINFLKKILEFEEFSLNHGSIAFSPFKFNV